MCLYLNSAEVKHLREILCCAGKHVSVKGEGTYNLGLQSTTIYNLNSVHEQQTTVLKK